MARVQTCPKCRALLPPGTRTCPYCDASQRSVRAPTADADASATSRLGAWLLAAIVIIYFLSVQFDPMRGDIGGFQPSGQSLIGFGAMDARQISECGQIWRFVTANFLHADLMHLLFNAVGLLIVVPIAAVTFGATRTLCIVFGAGIAGVVTSYLSGTLMSVGASAALCGMIAALAVYGKRRGSPDLVQRMVMWGAMIVVFGFLMPGIDNWGHAGGFAGGALIGWPASAVRARGSRVDSLWTGGAAAFLALAIVVAAVWQVPSIVRTIHRREASLYWKDVGKAILLMENVSTGRAAASDLPEEIKGGPGDSAELVAAMNAALAAVRSGSAEGSALLRQASLAFVGWEGDIGCGYDLRFVRVAR